MGNKEVVEGCYFNTGSGCLNFRVFKIKTSKYKLGYPILSIDVENYGQKLNHIEFIIDPADIRSLGEMLIRIIDLVWKEILTDKLCGNWRMVKSI